jgi:Protein of unknown function (DUF3667)
MGITASIWWQAAQKGWKGVVMAIEAAGDALTGGLIARAIEPQAGEDAPGADGLTHEHKCLNCAAALSGPYCGNCGQHAHIHRTLSAIFHDILHGVFHFEGKIWSTIPTLFWNPGDLTRRYIHGERAKFVSPLALFLFSVFLMFAVFESVGGPVRFNNETPAAEADAAARKDNLRKTVVAVNETITALNAERAAALKNGQPTADIDRKLQDAGEKLGAAAKGVALSGGFSLDDLKMSAQIDTGSKEFDAIIVKGLKNPQLLVYKLQSSAYKFAWALIPLSLPFMWLMFAWKRQYRMYDHAVFVTYSLCFVMQLLIAMALVAAIGLNPGALIFAIPLHFYWQLKGAYQLGIGGAIVRSLGLITVSLFVLTGFGLVLLALGLSG